MCELFCHGCKKPLTLCTGHQEIYLWVEKQDLFLNEQVILNREMSSIDDPFEGDFDDFDDFNDLPEVDLTQLPDLASPSVQEEEEEDYSEFNSFLEALNEEE